MRIRKIPPILTGIVHTALQACDGVRFHADSTCHSCGGTVSGYDEREKRFAVLVEDDTRCPVQVIIRRSCCKACGKFALTPEPFYPGTRAGSPVVDLCRALSSTMSYSRASTYLLRMGVVVDRWSVRQYAQMSLPAVQTMDAFGMQIPVSIIALSTLAGSVQEPATLTMDDVQEACNYPSVPRELSGLPDRMVGENFI
ncbi:MAG: hypothetical protein WCX22_10870 [Methanoregula sp.]